jgi:hypothetical protein
MPSCTVSSFIAAFSKVFVILHARDYQPAMNVMVNECSKGVEKHIRANKMYIQLVPLHNHQVNATERAITTFIEHFVAALATVDMLCPLQLWDKFIPQVELTLNLLSFSLHNPRVSANQELYSLFNFNKTQHLWVPATSKRYIDWHRANQVSPMGPTHSSSFPPNKCGTSLPTRQSSMVKLSSIFVHRKKTLTAFASLLAVT